MTISGLGLTATNSTGIALSTAASASAAIATIDAAINTVNSQRATIGAAINRMTYAVDNITNISSNTSASRSTIMDTDYATASTNLSKTQIIQQAATAMLAQANQQPQSVLALIK
jgi:flagellin